MHSFLLKSYLTYEKWNCSPLNVFPSRCSCISLPGGASLPRMWKNLYFTPNSWFHPKSGTKDADIHLFCSWNRNSVQGEPSRTWCSYRVFKLWSNRESAENYWGSYMFDMGIQFYKFSITQGRRWVLLRVLIAVRGRAGGLTPPGVGALGLDGGSGGHEVGPAFPLMRTSPKGAVPPVRMEHHPTQEEI